MGFARTLNTLAKLSVLKNSFINYCDIIEDEFSFYARKKKKIPLYLSK